MVVIAWRAIRRKVLGLYKKFIQLANLTTRILKRAMFGGSKAGTRVGRAIGNGEKVMANEPKVLVVGEVVVVVAVVVEEAAAVAMVVMGFTVIVVTPVVLVAVVVAVTMLAVVFEVVVMVVV